MGTKKYMPREGQTAAQLAGLRQARDDMRIEKGLKAKDWVSYEEKANEQAAKQAARASGVRYKKPRKNKKRSAGRRVR